MAVEIAIVLFGVAIAIGAVWIAPDTTESLFTSAMRIRRVLFTIVGVVIALVFIGTGDPVYVAIGLIGVVYATLYFYLGDPLDGVFTYD